MNRHLRTLAFLGAGALLPALMVPACGDDAPAGGGAGGATGGSGGRGGSGGSSKGGSGGSTSGGSGGSATGGSGGGSGGSDGGADVSSSDGGGDVSSSETGDGASGETGGGDGGTGAMSFFVTSETSKTGNLGGLAGADAKCQKLATAAGSGKTWAAYLSAEKGGANDGPVHAKDRIGPGPWYNAKGALVAANLAALHTRKGDYKVFLDEKGAFINGQWDPSKTPNEHDILTGSNVDGTVKAGFTCKDWTSPEAADKAWVGHSDGLGPNMDTANGRDIWNSTHENGGCNDTSPRGGAGRIYCFAK